MKSSWERECCLVSRVDSEKHDSERCTGEFGKITLREIKTVSGRG